MGSRSFPESLKDEFEAVIPGAIIVDVFNYDVHILDYCYYVFLVCVVMPCDTNPSHAKMTRT